MNYRLPQVAFILCVALAGWTGPIRAEVSHHQGRTLIAAITDGSDPFGHNVWDPLRPLPEAAHLNPDGSARGDGPPNVKWDAEGNPHVVWAYNKGRHHDIAYSYWRGEAWSPIEFVGPSRDNALDPQLFIADDGAAYLTWWTEERQRILTSIRLAGSAGWNPPEVHTSLGKRPTIAVFDGVVRLAFEVSVAGLEQHAIAIVRGNGIPESYVSGLRDGRLDPILHVLAGTLWLDYKAQDEEMGVQVLEILPPEDPEENWGGLTTPWRQGDSEPWQDPSWVGVEFSRRAIQLRLLTEASEDDEDPDPR